MTKDDAIKILREAVEQNEKDASGMRTWGGMGWVYHSIYAKRVFEWSTAALEATADIQEESIPVPSGLPREEVRSFILAHGETKEQIRNAALEEAISTVGSYANVAAKYGVHKDGTFCEELPAIMNACGTLACNIRALKDKS